MLHTSDGKIPGFASPTKTTLSIGYQWFIVEETNFSRPRPVMSVMLNELFRCGRYQSLETRTSQEQEQDHDVRDQDQDQDQVSQNQDLGLKTTSICVTLFNTLTSMPLFCFEYCIKYRKVE